MVILSRNIFSVDLPTFTTANDPFLLQVPFFHRKNCFSCQILSNCRFQSLVWCSARNKNAKFTEFFYILVGSTGDRCKVRLENFSLFLSLSLFLFRCPHGTVPVFCSFLQKFTSEELGNFWLLTKFCRAPKKPIRTSIHVKPNVIVKIYF